MMPSTRHLLQVSRQKQRQQQQMPSPANLRINATIADAEAIGKQEILGQSLVTRLLHAGLQWLALQHDSCVFNMPTTEQLKDNAGVEGSKGFQTGAFGQETDTSGQ